MKSFFNYSKIFFIGIGGISMSALALLLKSDGYEVLGSDISKNEIVNKLRKNNIKVYNSHRAGHVKGCDLVVFSGAIKEDNPQIIYAKKNNIEVMERSKLLGIISKRYKKVIAISGTHGKTTTTAMLGYIFLIAGLNPTIHIGGDFPQINGNIHIGGKDFFITEACEFRDSFLELNPNVSVVTNIEPEHLDYFKTFENEVMSFNKFVERTKEIAFIDLNYKELFRDDLPIMYFNGKKLSAKNLILNDDGKYSFDCYKDKKLIGNFKLNSFGKHNVYNALAVISVCMYFNISVKVIQIGLETFRNVKRRFEIVGNIMTNIVIHDYAHHPSEIQKSIKTCKEIFDKRVICIFQPHTYSRTKFLINEFIFSFDKADELYLVESYSAREKYEYLGSVEYLKDRILSKNPCKIIKGVFKKEEINKILLSNGYKNCIFLFLGAGDIDLMANQIVNKKR